MRSTRYAVFLAVGYALFAIVYIVVSSRIAASMSASVEQMRRIETLKGVLYVFVTAVGVGLGAWVFMRRLEHAHDAIRRRDEAILLNERQAFAGLLAATTAHDANNVLMAVIADLEGMKAARVADAPVGRLEAATERLIALNRRLLDTVRQGREVEPTEVSLMQEIHAAVEAIRTTLRVRGCDVRIDGDGDVRMRAHPLLIQRIVGNLVLNAAEAAGSHGRIDVRLVRDDGHAAIEVHDNGPGVPVARRAGLFDALTTTKSTGSGLGLFSVKACAHALGGHAEVTTSPLGGACFRVLLPVARPSLAASAAVAAVPAAATH